MRNDGSPSLGWWRSLALACIVVMGLGTIVGSGGGGGDPPPPPPPRLGPSSFSVERNSHIPVLDAQFAHGLRPGQGWPQATRRAWP